MTATMTAAPRSGAVYALPQTQNTAPVHEFRCLYTRDIHKKAKKWHDGSLRFHTFNQRVMVYDDAKNYIGDLHYRQEEDLDEGTELQLDRGVKVEVGERLGETQTDLAPLLDRRRAEDNNLEEPSPRRSQRPVCVPRNYNVHSQRPKSLAEVLGASQGRLGHTNVNSQSPYEQRQASLSEQQHGPPNKRQKVLTPPKSLKESRSEISRPRSVAVESNRATVFTNSLPPNPTNKALQQLTKVIDVSTDLDQRAEPSSPVQRLPKAKTTYSKEMAVHRSNVESLIDGVVRGQTQSREPVERARMRTKATSISQKEVTADDTSKKTKRRSTSSMTRLLLNPSKTRKKLMYTDLLPGMQRQSSGAGESELREPQRAIRARHFSPASSIEGGDSVFGGSPVTRSDFADFDLDVQPLYSPPAPPSSAISVNSSPLFIPTQRSNPSPVKSIFSLHEDFASIPIPRNEANPSPKLQRNDDQNRLPSDESPMRPEGLRSPLNPPRSNEKPLIHPRVLNNPFYNPRPVSPLRKSPFRQILSENNASFPDDTLDFDDLGNPPSQELTRPILEESDPNQIPHHRLPNPPLDRSASDSSTASSIKTRDLQPSNPKPAIVGPSKEEPSSDQEQTGGPWTTTEAFLLFGGAWWPPGREKPGEVRSWTELLTAEKGQQSYKRIENAPFAQITTAKEVLLHAM